MKKIIFLILINSSFILYGQINPNHPDLGLYGIVTWIDNTHIKVEYDWSDDYQLLDWVMTDGSTLVRGNGFVTITDGSISSVRAMIWKQGIKCTRIYAKDAAPLSSAGHLNFYSNMNSFNGYYLPNPGLGAVLISNNNFWTHDGANAGYIGAPFLDVGVSRDYDYYVSTAGMTIKSSVNDIIYSYNSPCVPVLNRKIALGGYGGNTRWGKIIIEGEIETVPGNVINFQSNGAVFSPVIEVVGTPVIEWIFDDSTTSASVTPVKDYRSEGSRHNYLKVTPWSSLIGINVGYDASDGGYGGFAIVTNQNVLGIENLTLAKSSLQYLCASHNLLMTELDLRELTALKFIELYYCPNLTTLRLDSHPVLERLCVEDCNLGSLDLSGCTALEDLRGALNKYTSINWGSTGQSLWHLCIRDNPQMTVNIPDLTHFPKLRESLTWNANQTGAFVCHSSLIHMIQSDSNHYTSADISGCTSLVTFHLSKNKLTSLDLGTAESLSDINLKDCGLTESQVDYGLITLDGAGKPNGYLDLTGNAAPSADGFVHLDNLKRKGWILVMVPVTGITITVEEGASTITTDNGTLQLSPAVLPTDATDKRVTWLVVNGTGQATISDSGLVTAINNGTVTVMATSNDGSGVYGTLIINISNQIISLNDLPLILGKIIVTSNEIKVFLNDCFISWKADLFNLQGMLLISQIAESDILTFNISTFPSGYYIIVLSQGENVRVANVIKP